MRYLIILLCAGCVASGPADVVDIKGYIGYISDTNYYYYYNDSLSAPGELAFLIDGAEITLYKRDSSSGWDQYGDSTYSDDGYYVFEDIDTGRDPGDLCTNSAWFRIEFDATESLQGDWDFAKIQDRFSQTVARPSGLPDSGSIRVDCVLFGKEYVVYDGSSANPDIDEVEGHWVTESNDTLFSLNSATGEGTCPIGQNPIGVGSCLVGHFHHDEGLSDWADEDDYAEYDLWPDNGDSADVIVRGYHYWTLPWPTWALHTFEDDTLKLMWILDFVHLEP